MSTLSKEEWEVWFAKLCADRHYAIDGMSGTEYQQLSEIEEERGIEPGGYIVAVSDTGADKLRRERDAALAEVRRLQGEYNRTLNDLTAARNANTALIAENEILKEQIGCYDYQAAVQMGAILS